LRILRRDPGHLFPTHPLHLRQLRYHILQITALIPLAPKRHRTQIRRIRLQYHMLQWDIL